MCLQLIPNAFNPYLAAVCLSYHLKWFLNRRREGYFGRLFSTIKESGEKVDSNSRILELEAGSGTLPRG
ncbi:MAG: hypothetical protein ACP5TZ_01045 [Nitrososphaeria archaeon]